MERACSTSAAACNNCPDPNGGTVEQDKRVLFITLVLSGLSTIQTMPTAAEGLSQDDIARALQSKKAVTYEIKTSFSFRKNSFGGESVAFVSTAYSRLTWLAQDARERFEELSPDAIAKAAADTQVCVSSGTTELKVQAIVLVPRSIDKPKPSEVIKPNELSVDVVDMYNKLGGRWKEASYTACFPSELHLDDLDVLVVYANNSRSHNTGMNKSDFRGHFPKNMK
jgi:hypothetical protein